jgi:23S rRNA pseudouridine1911/1915/1917 synthase
MKLEIIYEDENVKVIDKPAGIVVDNFKRPAHRLDKDTSGVLLLAKDDKSLKFLQRQFKNRTAVKKYLALVIGNLKNKEGVIETLLARSPKDKRKQRAYLAGEPVGKEKTLRNAVTEYKVRQRFKNYDLVEVYPRTGRKHQIRCHFAYLGHPVAGDKMYGFKNQPCPQNLNRQFLHSSYLRIELPNKKNKEFKVNLPKDLELCLQNLKLSSKIN